MKIYHSARHDIGRIFHLGFTGIIGLSPGNHHLLRIEQGVLRIANKTGDHTVRVRRQKNKRVKKNREDRTNLIREWIALDKPIDKDFWKIISHYLPIFYVAAAGAGGAPPRGSDGLPPR